MLSLKYLSICIEEEEEVCSRVLVTWWVIFNSPTVSDIKIFDLSIISAQLSHALSSDTTTVREEKSEVKFINEKLSSRSNEVNFLTWGEIVVALRKSDLDISLIFKESHSLSLVLKLSTYSADVRVVDSCKFLFFCLFADVLNFFVWSGFYEIY